MNPAPVPKVPGCHGDEQEKDTPEIRQPKTKQSRELCLDPHEPDARKPRVGNGDRRQEHESLVSRRIPTKHNARGHEHRECDHLLEFERQKLWRIVWMTHLPHLIDEGSGET